MKMTSRGGGARGRAFLATAGLSSASAYRSSTTPEQVRVAFGDDPRSSVRIVWQTAQPTRQRLVEFGETPSLGRVEAGTRPTYAYETGALAEVSLTRLRPGRTYYYRVGDPEGGWSPIRTFRTVDRSLEHFSFTAFGDHGIAPDSQKNVQNIVRERPAFHVLLGDISYANGNQPVWDDYFRQIEPMAATIPTMPVLGNHENEKLKMGEAVQPIGYVAYLARFALPGKETWYAFSVGSARFLGLNSDDPKNPEQLRWLEEELRRARRDRSVGWVIVLQHHPLFGSTKGRGDNAPLAETLQPFFDRYHVDLVLSGHDHHYERQHPLRGTEIVQTTPSPYQKGRGTLYLTQGGGGKSLYDFVAEKPEKCAIRDRSSGYLKVTVAGKKRLSIESKRVDGSLIEIVEIIEQ